MLWSEDEGVGPEIAGALARFWTGGGGPSHSSIGTAFSLAGYHENIEGNKEDRVRIALRRTPEPVARHIAEELLVLLRSSGVFDRGDEDPRVRQLVGAFARNGFSLSPEGFVDWNPGDTSEPASAGVASSEPESAPAAQRTPIGEEIREVSVPTRELLIDSLRRVSSAIRPLVRRRRDREGLSIADEYDLQDIVESLLRCLYNDVRAEERTPSSGGSSSAMDFLLRENAFVVEVKVTRPGRTDRHIKQELLVDFEDYQHHPSVRHLIAVVYDIASTFENAAGFEFDMSGQRGTLNVDVLVVGWPLR